ncbi:hypothetical protein LCGC14_2720840, partial [marine sediment metagenome]
AYVERNPVRARLVRKPWRYAWSSAAAHCGDPPVKGAPDASSLLDLAEWQKLLAGADWRGTLSLPTDERMIGALRSSTSRGRPLGSDSFLSKLERALGRRLRPLPVGRPRKKNRPKAKRRKA